MTEDDKARVARLRWITYSLFVAVLFAFAVVYWQYGSELKDATSEAKAAAGQFGDYFGGILNPLVALFALAALFESLNVQREELSETRDELRETRKAAQRQASHFERQGKLDDLSRAATMLQGSLDSALSAPMRIGSVHRRGDPVPVPYTANLEDSLGWCLALADSPDQFPPPHTPQNAQNVGEMLLARSNSLPPEVFTQCVKVVELLAALVSILGEYEKIEPTSKLTHAYKARFRPVAKAMRIAGGLEEQADVASYFDVLAPADTPMATTAA